MSFLFKKKKKGPKTRDLSPIQKLAKNSSNLANTITTSLTSLNKKETGEGNYPALESDKKLEDDFGVQPREEFKNSPPLTREAKTYNEAYVGNDSPQMPPSGSGEPTFSPKSPKRRSVNFDHSFEVDDINRRRSVDSTRSNQSYDFDQLDKSTQKLINKLKFEISELQDENISLKTDYQCAIENYEAQISELTEENTRLKTQVNSVVRRDRDRTTGSLGLTSPASSLSPEHKNYANLEESTGGLEAGNVLNSSEPTGTRSSGHHSASHTNQLQPSSEQFNNIIKMLEHQINELLQEKYDQKINQAIRNFSDTPSKLKHLIPNWVINFDDMGPLVRSYDARLKKAFALLKVHEDKYQRDRDQVIPALNLEIEGLKRNNSKLQNHLVEMGNKLQVQEQEMERKNREQESTQLNNTKIIEEFNTQSQLQLNQERLNREKLVNETKEILELEMNQKIKFLEDENNLEIKEITHNFELEKSKMAKQVETAEAEKNLVISDLEVAKQENEKLNLEIAKGNEQLKLAIENNKKYLASIDILVIKCENYTKDLIKAKNSEKNWKNQTKKSVNLLERALEERDIFHLLAAREHENCRHAINSASGLKLQHLKELSELFKNNVDSGKLMNFHSGKLKNMNQEVGLIKACLEVNADSLSGKQHRENNQKLLKQIDEINLALKEESSLLADSGITVGLKDRKHLRDSLGASSSGSLDKSSEEDGISVKSAVLTAL